MHHMEGLPLIVVDRKAAKPLHRQIYDSFRESIIRGDLLPGHQILSTRLLAIELGISRIPVLNAYAQLMAEGYFESRTGAGTFVCTSLPDAMKPTPPQVPRVARLGSGPRPGSRRALRLPEIENASWYNGWGAFGVHQPALDHFPSRIWSNLIQRHCRSPHPGVWHNINPLGAEKFRDAICTYLRTSRGVRCDPQQIMIVSGSQQALDITARVLFDEKSPVWAEEPGYRLAKNAFTAAGCRLIPVRVDSDGMDVTAGIKMCRNARAAYVTPSHQYPLGSTMSASRRFQLLHWAQAAGAWIIEDDYDGEYRFESMPIASLQGLDRNSRVIYIGTFSKVLFPSLRLGYIVIPLDLVDRFIAVRAAMDIFPPYLFQEVLTDFLQEGHFARHIRKTRLLYKERRTALVESIYEQLGTTLEVHGEKAGMHLAVTLPKGLNDREISMRAASQGLRLVPISPNYMGSHPRHGFILGYGSTPVTEMSDHVRRLRKLIRP